MAKETAKEALKAESNINNIYAKLSRVQNALTAKKDNTNQFGKYCYRTAEGIMEKLKPLFEKEGLAGYFTNEEIVDNLFKCSFRLVDLKSREFIETHHETPVDSDLRGMSRGQMGGATASYCRKYLLCGLFLVDGGDHDLDERDQAGDIEAAIETAESLEKLKAIYEAQKSFLNGRKDLLDKITKRRQYLEQQK